MRDFISKKKLTANEALSSRAPFRRQGRFVIGRDAWDAKRGGILEQLKVSRLLNPAGDGQVQIGPNFPYVDTIPDFGNMPARTPQAYITAADYLRASGLNPGQLIKSYTGVVYIESSGMCIYHHYLHEPYKRTHDLQLRNIYIFFIMEM